VSDIPFATGTADQIVSAAKVQIANTDPWSRGAPEAITVFAPDGSSYTQGGTLIPSQQVASYQADLNKGETPLTFAGQPAAPFPALTPAYPYRNSKRIEGQLYRKVESISGFQTFYAGVKLPESVGLFKLQKTVGEDTRWVSDGVFMYTGGYVQDTPGSEIDAGLMRNVNGITGAVNPHYNLGALANYSGKRVNRYDPTCFIYPQTPGVLTLASAEPYMSTKTKGRGVLCVRYQGDVRYRAFLQSQAGDVAILFYASGWGRGNQPNWRGKYIASLAQMIRPGVNDGRVPVSGYYRASSPSVNYARYADWGLVTPDEQDSYVLWNGSNWSPSVTDRQGVFPNYQAVASTVHNQWFWETSINLEAFK
jgi:hypothetical protein